MVMSLVANMKNFLPTYPEILLSFLCFFIFYYYSQINRKSSIIPKNWLLVGMLPDLLMNLKKLHDWVTNILRETACTFTFFGPWFLGFDFLITCDPANLQHIFNVNFSNYPKGKEFSEIFDILGDGIFNADEESWKRQRMKAHRLINDRKFQAFVTQYSQRKVELGLLPLVNQIAKQEMVIDLQDVFLRFTFDSTCCLVFGVDPSCLSIDFPTIPFAKAMDDAMQALFFRHTFPTIWWKLMKLLKIGDERKLAGAWIAIDNFTHQSIADKKRQNSKQDIDARADLLSSYIDDNDDNSNQDIDVKVLRDTAINFMLAGRDTTGAALTWFFWLISEYPEVERKILDEIKSELLHNTDYQLSNSSTNNDFKAFDNEELGALVYLHAALCEALRLFPPVPFEHKAAQQAEVLPSGHKVEAGTRILVSLYSMARIEGIWGEDCMEFRPERWISDKGRIKYEPSYKFLSFNSGPRTCLGKEVAFTQMKAVATAMIYNFQVEVVEGHVVEPKLSIILHMKNGLMVRIKRRAQV